ncbi:MAG: L-idonate 5-dehydrogenase [Bauldia litoralis]
MKAIVIHAPGDLRVDQVAAPTPGPGEVQVQIGAGGICGSDLHYYHNGGFGDVRLKEPMILGHEIAGTVIDVGPGVSSVRPGDKVAVNPSLACGTCAYCQAGLQNHCTDMHFYGSAMRFPHVQGAFRELLVCKEAQAVAVPSHVSLDEAAFAEPFAVALHAVSRAGPLVGKTVLVTGSGPIGVLIVAAARLAGAGTIVVSDILDEPLAFATAMGADTVVNTGKQPDGLAGYESGKGTFDAVFEASGSGAAVIQALRVLRPRGALVCVGQGGQANLAMSAVVTREIELRGAFRFHTEFRTAVDFIAGGRVALRPLLTAAMPADDAKDAFDLASDKSRSMKVQLRF